MTSSLQKLRSAPVALDPDAVLDLLASRYSCREFDDTPIDRATIEAILKDGTESPSSCNQQNWHFIAVDDPAMRMRAHDIAGGNHHFAHCAVLVYLCFQKGYTHDKFSVVQSVAGAAYHMMLSAHVRGFSSIWNAGIGDLKAIAELLQVPPNFEIIGAIAIGRAKPTATPMKAPRRPLGEVWSWNGFSRPSHAIYPLKPAAAYPFFEIRNFNHPFAQWDPAEWGWDRVGDLRGYAVWAKSPIAGVYVSRRQGEATAVEVGQLPELKPGAHLVELMGWGGTYSVELRRRYGPAVHLHLAELSRHNHSFIAERIRAEGLSDANLHADLIPGGKLPYADNSIDAVFLPQVLEHMPEPMAMLDEVLRVLRPGGTAVVSARNSRGPYGVYYRKQVSREQIANLGPHKPLSATMLRRELAARFRIEESFGLGREATGDATRIDGRSRYNARLFVARLIKR